MYLSFRTPAPRYSLTNFTCREAAVSFFPVHESFTNLLRPRRDRKQPYLSFRTGRREKKMDRSAFLFQIILSQGKDPEVKVLWFHPEAAQWIPFDDPMDPRDFPHQ